MPIDASAYNITVTGTLTTRQVILTKSIIPPYMATSDIEIDLSGLVTSAGIWSKLSGPLKFTIDVQVQGVTLASIDCVPALGPTSEVPPVQIGQFRATFRIKCLGVTTKQTVWSEWASVGPQFLPGTRKSALATVNMTSGTLTVGITWQPQPPGVGNKIVIDAVTLEHV
jgi:hypothetical protein